MAEQPTNEKTGVPAQIGFDYIKSNYFRVISVHGVYGGLSPRGQLTLALWNERKPIAQHVVHSLKQEDGQMILGDEVSSERVVRDSIVREVEVCATLDIPTAKAIAGWMIEKIQEFEEKSRSESGASD